MQRRSDTHEKLRNELGVQDPVGFWDPAGFTADGSVEDFKRRRQTEIKHGRIATRMIVVFIVVGESSPHVGERDDAELILSFLLLALLGRPLSH